MSYGGSPKVISAGLLAVLLLLLPGDAHAAGGSVIISATIQPVRIVVVNDNDTITRIFSNSPGTITPSVHRHDPDGPAIALSPAVYRQYMAIIRQSDTHKTGMIYASDTLKRPGAGIWRAANGPARMRSVMLPGLKLY